MAFVDLSEYLTVNTEWIKGIRKTTEGQTLVYISLSGIDDVEITSLPFEYLKSVLSVKQDKSEVYLKQLAQNQQSYVG